MPSSIIDKKKSDWSIVLYSTYKVASICLWKSQYCSKFFELWMLGAVPFPRPGRVSDYYHAVGVHSNVTPLHGIEEFNRQAWKILLLFPGDGH